MNTFLKYTDFICEKVVIDAFTRDKAEKVGEQIASTMKNHIFKERMITKTEYNVLISILSDQYAAKIGYPNQIRSISSIIKNASYNEALKLRREWKSKNKNESIIINMLGDMRFIEKQNESTLAEIDDEKIKLLKSIKVDSKIVVSGATVKFEKYLPDNEMIQTDQGKYGLNALDVEQTKKVQKDQEDIAQIRKLKDEIEQLKDKRRELEIHSPAWNKNKEMEDRIGKEIDKLNE